MTTRPIVQRVLLTGAITLAVWAVGASRGPSAQICFECPPPPPEPVVTCPVPSEGFSTCVAPFSPDMDTWTYLFLPNNSIKIGTTASCVFPLRVDMIRISQAEYAARRKDPEFADTVCNPTAAPPDSTDCVFYRVHGETVPKECYDTAKIEYKIFWNDPPIQGNKHDWMLLRAPCDEFDGDTTHCVNNPPFSENITLFVDRKPPVGTDPVVGGDADGMSDYIVAISNRHPHGTAIPPTIQ